MEQEKDMQEQEQNGQTSVMGNVDRELIHEATAPDQVGAVDCAISEISEIESAEAIDAADDLMTEADPQSVNEIVPMESEIMVATVEPVLEQKKSLLQLLVLCLLSGAALLGLVSIREWFSWVAVACWAYPVVIALLAARYGMLVGLGTLGVAYGLTYAVWGPVIALSTLIHMGLVGVLFGIGVRRQWSGKAIVLITTVLYGGLFAVSGFLSMNVYSAFYRVLAEVYQWYSDLVRGFAPALMREGLVNMIPGGDLRLVFAVIQMLAPGFVFLRSGVLVLFYYLLTGFVLRRQGIAASRLPAFRSWRAPKWLLAVFLVLLLSSFASGIKISILYVFLVNGVLLGTLLFFLFGLAVLWDSLCRVRNILLRIVLAVCCVALLKVSAGILVVVGVLDSIFDLRRFYKTAQPSAVMEDSSEYAENLSENLSEESVELLYGAAEVEPMTAITEDIEDTEEVAYIEIPCVRTAAAEEQTPIEAITEGAVEEGSVNVTDTPEPVDVEKQE